MFWKMDEDHQEGESLIGRLRGVRKRKRSRSAGDRDRGGGVAPYACSVVASKMKLVKAGQRRDRCG
jgi:hypothetical protein